MMLNRIFEKNLAYIWEKQAYISINVTRNILTDLNMYVRKQTCPWTAFWNPQLQRTITFLLEWPSLDLHVWETCQLQCHKLCFLPAVPMPVCPRQPASGWVHLLSKRWPCCAFSGSQPWSYRWVICLPEFLLLQIPGAFPYHSEVLEQKHSKEQGSLSSGREDGPLYKRSLDPWHSRHTTVITSTSPSLPLSPPLPQHHWPFSSSPPPSSLPSSSPPSFVPNTLENTKWQALSQSFP